MSTRWWDEMAQEARNQGCETFTRPWYVTMRDLYVQRFPNADQRSLDNMNLLAEWAEH